MNFNDIPQLPRASYETTVPWDSLEDTIARYQSETFGACLNLEPDFQRAHVWTQEQQIRYVEYSLMGGEVGRNLTFNCPGWMNDFRGPYEIVDGKQRLEAVRSFLRGDIAVFGYYFHQIEGRPHSVDVSFNWRVCNLKSRAAILQMYLNINSGGTPHTQVELNKVRKMLANLKEKNG